MTLKRLNRRAMLSHTATGVGALALIAVGQACKTRGYNTSNSAAKATDDSGPIRVRVRKAWHTLNAAEKELYKKGVAALNAEVVAPGREYTTQFQRLAYIHQNSCPHNNWFFLPWHRNYLALYEAELVRVLGDEGKDFSLPYWDWTASPEVIAEFYEPNSPLNPEFLHRGTPFALPRDVPLGTLLDDAVVGQASLRRILGTTDFYSFGSYPSANTNVAMEDERAAGGLEGIPHNNVHGTLGGNMGAFLSPMDPIFWLHHGNVDRLWNVWMQGKTDVLPYTPTRDSVTFRTGDGDLVVSLEVIDASGVKVTDYTQYWLDYEYRLDAGNDVLHRGTKSRDLIDSSAFVISGLPTASAFRYDTDPVPVPAPAPVVQAPVAPAPVAPAPVAPAPVAPAPVAPSEKAAAPAASGAPAALRAPRKKRRISSVGFTNQAVASSDTTFAAKIDVAETLNVLMRFFDAVGAGKDAGAFVVVSKVPVPQDAAVRAAAQIRVRAADAQTRDRDNPRGELGNFSFFHHGMSGAHAAHASPFVTLSLEVTEFLKALDVKKLPRSIWVSGAFEMKKNVAKPAGWDAFRAGLNAQLKTAQSNLKLTLVVRTEA